MPVIGENIVLASTTPNFARDKVKTVSDLRWVKVKHYDIGHIVYCEEDKRHYIFRGEEIPLDEVYGYFEPFNETITTSELSKMLKELNVNVVYPAN